ncbi:hypothetical protein NMY22_g13030 [Coprinellus aureogranulatus]|nr:hypothetical protein NMY22_g13030 [Coprinellus aureogranulatus]
MQNQERLFSSPNIPSIWLDRAIKQRFTEDGARRNSLLHMRRVLGPGWLYQLNGQTYYSPTCYRPQVKVPQPWDVADVRTGPALDSHKIERFRHPQWWSKSSAYLAFIPIHPDLSAPPLYPLLQYPEIKHNAGSGPYPDPQKWAEWQKLQRAMTEASHLLLKDSGAPAVRSVPYPCARVDRNVESGAYKGKTGLLYRDMSKARSWFEVWFGCLSYAIAVNEAIVSQVNALNLATSTRLPLSWVELMLIPYRERNKSRRNSSQYPEPGHPKTPIAGSSQVQPDQICEFPRPQNEVIDPVFVSSLRDTCIASFDGSVERSAGCLSGIPGERGKTLLPSVTLSFPDTNLHTTPSGQPYLPIQRSPRPLAATASGVDTSEEVNPLVGPLHEDDLINMLETSKPGLAPFERRPQLRESERSWEEFFAAASLKEMLLTQTETPQMKQEREARRLNPPMTRPGTAFYVWERSMRGTFRRRVATDEELEGLFQEKGQFGRKQSRYNPFFNEWDLCRYWGPPDDEQLWYRSGVRASLRGTTVEEEYLWWRIYYGLQPDPSAPVDLGDPVTFTLPLRSSQPDSTENGSQDALDNSFSTDVDIVDVRCVQNSCADSGLEEGEIPELEADLSWIARHAFHFLGFTMPPDFPDPENIRDGKPEGPGHAARLIGSRATGRYWSSKEGQATIKFAKSLASNNSMEPSTSDLFKWNATPITALPLFKHLRSSEASVVVQVEKWDNVKGRSVPELASRVQQAYWLDIPSMSSQLTWYVGTGSPELALALCRVGSSCHSDPLSIAWYFATRGVPFNTWFNRSPEQIRPLTDVRMSPQLIQFRLESQYQFGEKDYREYVRCRRRLLDGPAGRAAVRMGGIIWKLATNDIGLQEALSGIPSQDALCGQRVVRRVGEEEFLVDDGLNLDEIMAICAYSSSIAEGSQRGRKSWWPPPDIWEECHGSFGWSSFAEEFFLSRQAEIEETFTPVARSQWRERLRASSALRKARKRIQTQSAELLERVSEGGL